METFHIILQSNRLVVFGNRWQSLHKSSLNIKFFRSKLLSIGIKDSFYCQKQSPRGVHKNLKQSLWHKCSPVNFAKFLRTPFFIEHIWWLLLYCDLPVNLNSVFMTQKAESLWILLISEGMKWEHWPESRSLSNWQEQPPEVL